MKGEMGQDDYYCKEKLRPVGSKEKCKMLDHCKNVFVFQSVSSIGSKGSAQIEVKLPWYMGITCKVLN